MHGTNLRGQRMDMAWIIYKRLSRSHFFPFSLGYVRLNLFGKYWIIFIIDIHPTVMYIWQPLIKFVICRCRLVALGSRFKDLSKALTLHLLRVMRRILSVVQDTQVIPTPLTLLIRNHRLVNSNSGVWVTFKPQLIKSHP